LLSGKLLKLISGGDLMDAAERCSCCTGPEVSLWSQRAVLNATYSSLRIRPHAFKMPLQVKLNFYGQAEEHTIEFPDDATVLKVMEWASERSGMEVDRVKVTTVQGAKVLKKEELLSSNPRFLNLKITERGGGG
jgi:hypothetical protein